MPLCYKPIILDARLLVAVEAYERSQAKVGSHESMILRVSREEEGLGVCSSEGWMRQFCRLNFGGCTPVDGGEPGRFSIEGVSKTLCSRYFAKVVGGME